jgi:hypothetical protein
MGFAVKLIARYRYLSLTSKPVRCEIFLTVTVRFPTVRELAPIFVTGVCLKISTIRQPACDIPVLLILCWRIYHTVSDFNVTVGKKISHSTGTCQ